MRPTRRIPPLFLLLFCMSIISTCFCRFKLNFLFQIDIGWSFNFGALFFINDLDIYKIFNVRMALTRELTNQFTRQKQFNRSIRRMKWKDLCTFSTFLTRFFSFTASKRANNDRLILSHDLNRLAHSRICWMFFCLRFAQTKYRLLFNCVFFFFI